MYNTDSSNSRNNNHTRMIITITKRSQNSNDGSESCNRTTEFRGRAAVQVERLRGFRGVGAWLKDQGLEHSWWQ